MIMYDLGLVQVGNTIPCLCHRERNILAVEYWTVGHTFLILCACRRVIGLDAMGFLQFIVRQK